MSAAAEEVQLNRSLAALSQETASRKRQRASSVEIEAQRLVLKKKELAVLELQKGEYTKIADKMNRLKAKGIEKIQEKLQEVEAQIKRLKSDIEPDAKAGSAVLEKYSASAKFMRTTSSELHEARVSGKVLIRRQHESKPSFTVDKRHPSLSTPRDESPPSETKAPATVSSQEEEVH